MNPERPLKAPPAAGKTLVFRGVIRGLLHGQWSGGDRLTEDGASRLFHVSRTPVREALVELAAMGVLELRRNCGAVFFPFGEKELRDLYAVRSLLEVEAARLAARGIEQEFVARMTRAFTALRRQGAPDTEWRLDRELHAAVAGASGNPRLAGDIARYGDLIQTVREAVGGTLAGIHAGTTDDHLRILRALAKRDADAASAAMRRHLRHAADQAVTAFRNLRSSTSRKQPQIP